MIAAPLDPSDPTTGDVSQAAPSKRVAIIQSGYIPWKGYFDAINLVDEFILYDTVQYTVRDWRNRNRIKSRRGVQWLSVPVRRKGRRDQLIADVEVSDPIWARRHWDALAQAYAKASYFGDLRDRVEKLYLDCEETRLSALNERFIRGLCEMLGITTPISQAPRCEGVAGPTERLVDICRRSGATHYLTGPRAEAYLEAERFAAAGIGVEYLDYSGYPEYPQLFAPFEGGVSILDLLFNTGPDARRYMKTFPESLSAEAIAETLTGPSTS